MSFFKNKIVLSILIGVGAAVLLGVGFLLGGFGGSGENSDQQEAAEPAAADSALIRVTVNTEVHFQCAFTACPHIVETAAGELIGMSRAEIKAAYPEHEIVEFSRDRVVLRRTVEGCCPEHYIVKLADGRFSIQAADETTFVPNELISLSAEGVSLPAETEAELEAGVIFDSLEEINAYFENLES